VGSVVIHDQVNRHIAEHGGVDFLENGEELGAAMVALEASDHLARRSVQCRE
jgi:hypothetical protein